MNINFVRTLPHRICIAFSGGVDSVVTAHKALSQSKDVTLAFYHHGNHLADQEEAWVDQYASQHGLPVIKDRNRMPVFGSREKFWRDRRYEFLTSLDSTVVTGHNLDDAVEWYLMTCLRGEGHFMEYRHANVVRPMILTHKSTILEYARHHALTWFEDATNSESDFAARNRVRHEILPRCLEINPGLYTTVANRVREKIQ